MPSYLNEHSPPAYHPTSGTVHLNAASPYEGINNIDIKVNGQVSHATNSHTSNDSLDGSSSHSTHTSQSSDAAHMNGNDTRTSTMSSTIAQNATKEGSQDSIATGLIPGDAKKLFHANGGPITTSLPDRTLQTRLPRPNGTSDRSSKHSSAEEASVRTSMASAASGSVVQPSPIGMSIRQSQRGGDAASQDNTPSGTNLRASNNSFTQRSNLDPGLSSPQRFSSPAQMSGGTTSLSASTTNLHQTNAGLRHRHTLEVPRAGLPRGSRDGIDTALSSGRFSPTNAGPSAHRRASLSLVRRNTRSMHSDFPRDEAFPDEDAMRWAEAYRQKRASKRRRREEEDDDRVLVGTKVDEKHANWVTAYNMLTGIRVSVSRTNAKVDRPLTDLDFEAKQKSTFDITGNELVPSAKYDFKFKDYAPWVFRHLRQIFRLDPADYLMSLTGKYILSELGSPGKSGSFFYFSRDYRFIIKTIHHAEHKFLRKVLKEYYQHVTDNPNTLLSQFYGLHRVKTPWGRKIHFVVMNNLFPPHRDIHTTFDLKGSTVGRNFKEEDLEKNPRATLKDLNWLRRQRHLELGLEKKRLFMQQLQKDVKLMQKLQIMDYSLLIGIHDLRKGNDENLRARNLQVFSPGGDQAADGSQQVLMRTPSKLENQRRAAQMRQLIKAERPVPMGQSSSVMPDVLEEGAKSDSLFYSDDGGMRATHEDNTPGDEIYYLGVIDCLTHYGMIKKIEHFWKGLSSDKTQISALPPEPYGDRFLDFMSGITMSPEEAEREARVEEQAKAEEAASASKEKQGVQSWNSTGRRSTSHDNKTNTTATATNSNNNKNNNNIIPAAPTHQPPVPPGLRGPRSPEVEEMMRRAEQVAVKAEKHGYTERGVPERTLKTTSIASGSMYLPVATAIRSSSDRDSTNQPVLPVVDESGEGSMPDGSEPSSGVRAGRASWLRRVTAGTDGDDDGDDDDDDDGRILTGAKDGQDHRPGFERTMVPNVDQPNRAPPTPPKTVGSMAAGNGHSHPMGQGRRLTKPESADSGIGVHVSGRERSGSQLSKSSGNAGVTGQLSRESLAKALPPLPVVDGPA